MSWLSGNENLQKLPEHLFWDCVDLTLYQRTPGMIETKASFPQRDILNVFTYFDLIFITYSKFSECRIAVVMLGLNFYYWGFEAQTKF